MKSEIKDMLHLLTVISEAPPECADCYAFCEEGKIGLPCRGFYTNCPYKEDEADEDSD